MHISFLTLILIFPFVSFGSTKNYSIELGYGTGKLESESISTTVLQLTYHPKELYQIWGGSIGHAFGLRTTHYQADLFSANADNTSELIEDIDILSHNVFVQIHYTRDRYQLGFNLDVLGMTHSNSFNINDSTTKVDAETFNLFLGAENDKGSLNSTLFFAINLESLIIKAGASHSVIELDDTGLNGSANRQRFFDTFGLAIGYRF